MGTNLSILIYDLFDILLSKLWPHLFLHLYSCASLTMALAPSFHCPANFMQFSYWHLKYLPLFLEKQEHVVVELVNGLRIKPETILRIILNL